MKINVVNALKYKYEKFTTVLDGAYKFAPIGRLKWLQEKLWNFLLKKGAIRPVSEDRLRFTPQIIDTEQFMDKLYEQRREVFQFLGKSGETLLIGPDDFQELMSVSLNSYVSFSSEYISDHKVMNMTVKIIPWMRGMLVLP